MRRLAAVLALVLLTTCSDRPTGPVDPSAPGMVPQPGLDPGSPTTPLPSGAVTASSPNVAIFDGAHNGGNPHFFLRPPLVADPGTNGVFDGSRPADLRVGWQRVCAATGRVHDALGSR